MGAISGTLAAFSVEVAALQAAALGVNSLVQFWSAGNKIFQSPPKSVLVQPFTRLDESKNLEIQKYSIGHNSHLAEATQEARDAYVEFMSFYWTEERHYYLKELPENLIREVLRLISSSDLQKIVNLRRHQEDYIGDYLEYVWGIDEASFWDHLSATFGGEDGLLMYDNLHQMEMLTSRDMPMHVWDSMLSALLNVHWSEIERKGIGFPLEYFPEIMLFQTTQAADQVEKREQFIKFLSALKQADLHKLQWFIEKLYDNEIPEWLAPALRRLRQ